jgi:hypothetical protein
LLQIQKQFNYSDSIHMKKLLLSLVAIATLSLSSFGQAPEGFKYQAVVRDAGNLILSSQAVGMQLTIQQGSIGGTAVYTETFAPTTNAYGLVNLEIGSGTSADDFSTIDWANGPYFMETAVDVTGGTSYSVMGTSQLMSVPYALYAETSGTASALPSGTTSQTLRHDGSDWVADNTLVNDGSKVGVGDAATEPTAVFEVSSTTQGLLPPRMLQVQLNAIASPAAGLIVYCMDCGVGGEIQFSDGTQWRTMANEIPTPRFAEIQLGADIDGEAQDDQSGYSVSLSADGSRVAIGATLNTGANGVGSGHVRIYTWNGVTWVQTGADIDGEAQYDESGASVSLSADGSRVAIGSIENGGGSGHVRIYTWNGNTWVQTGADIDGEAQGDESGSSVSLSADGSRVAIGSIKNTGANGSNSGHVRIYTWNGNTWVQTGADIDGEGQYDLSGSSVSLSADGWRVAIGAINNNGANGGGSGHVRIYTWNGSAWVQTGADIDGEAQDDQSGYSVSLSADGSRVAIGANFNVGANGNYSGHVRIYTWNGNAWVQTGADIDGEAQGDESGSSVSLSANGSRVAIGAPYNNGANGNVSGHVRIYTWSGVTWVQTGADIDGEGEGQFDQSGSSVSLSADGSRVAIGAIGANSNGSGHVRVYE